MRTIDTSEIDHIFLSDDDNYWAYNGFDCMLTKEIKDKTKAQLDEVSGGTYQQALDMRAPVMEMMLRGLPTDQGKRQELISHYDEQIRQLKHILQRLCVEGLGMDPEGWVNPKYRGERAAINPGSPQQLAHLFYEVLGVKATKKRKKGADEATVTTDRETLEKIGNLYQHTAIFVSTILALRDATKSRGFLLTKLDRDNHLRCSFNIAGTNTGRMSSSFSDMGTGTNLQNIAGRLKEYIVAPPGRIFLDIDLEQADSRNVGALCYNLFYDSYGETFASSYLNACESGDLHTTVCRMAWPELDWAEGGTLDDHKKIASQIAYRELSYRDMAKKLGHGTNYYGKPHTMAGHTKVPTKQIELFQSAYFGAFPCIPEWHKWTINELHTKQSLTHLFGRRRYFWGDLNAQPTINAAIAYSPQGMTGDAMNRGKIQLWRYREATNMDVWFHLQVHDSLVLSVPTERVNDYAPQILEVLKAKLILKGGREYYIPHGIKTGWNYGKADPKKNKNVEFGLMDYGPAGETRQPPKRTSFFEALERKL